MTLYFYRACFNKFGSILKDIVELAKGVEVSYNFIPRTCNSIVHGLVRHAFSSLLLGELGLFVFKLASGSCVPKY